MKAAITEVNITPPVGISMCGFAARKGPSEAINDELFARALVLDNGETQVAIVGADVISFAPDLVNRISGFGRTGCWDFRRLRFAQWIAFPFWPHGDGVSEHGRPRCRV